MAENMEPIAFEIIKRAWPMIEDGMIRSPESYRRLGKSFSKVANQLEGYTRDRYLETDNAEGVAYLRDRIASVLDEDIRLHVLDAAARLTCDLSFEGLVGDESNTAGTFWSSRMLNTMAVVAGYEDDAV